MVLTLVCGVESYKISSETVPTTSHFNILRQIGEGTFSSVYVAEAKYDRRIFAIKTVNRFNCREVGEWEYFLNELEMLKRLRNHQFVVRLYFAFEDVSDRVIVGLQRLLRH